MIFPFLHFLCPYSLPNPQSLFVPNSKKKSDEMIILDSFQGLPRCEIKQKLKIKKK